MDTIGLDRVQQTVLDARPACFHHVVEETVVRRRFSLWAVYIHLLAGPTFDYIFTTFSPLRYKHTDVNNGDGKEDI